MMIMMSDREAVMDDACENIEILRSTVGMILWMIILSSL
jgi:hypothetical protein